LRFWQLRGALLATLAWLTPPAIANGKFNARLSVEQTESTQADQAGSPNPSVDVTAAYEGQPIEEIRWPNVVSATDQNRFRQLIPQKAGAPVDRDLIRQSIGSLYATGSFADVRVEADRAADGKIILSFITTPNYFIGQVRVVGAPHHPTEAQIVSASKLSLGELFSNDKMDRALENIKRLAEENGYYRSFLTADEKQDAATQQISIIFHLDAGVQARVGSVLANCDPACDQKQIQTAAKLRPGDLASPARASSALERLRNRYQKQNRLLAQVLIANKSYRAEANAIDYTLQITPGPKVILSAEGFKVKQSTLKQSVPIFEENAVDEDLLNEGRRNLLNYLQGRGYFDAKVGLKQQSDDPKKELHIIYVIDAGARHKLATVEIAGNHYFRTDLLRPRLQVQAASRWFTHGRYTQALLANDVRGLENLYKANGFQNVKITSSVMDDYEGHENVLAVRILIEEGPQTRVASFQILGNKSFSQAQLAAEINTTVGEPFSEYNIAQDRDNILNFYFNHGFPQATFEATAKPISGEANRMDVTFTIQEGEQVFVNQVIVSGLVHTKPYVVNRELQIAHGDPLSQLDMLQTQQRLYDLGIFSEVDTAVQNPNGEETQKNVLVDAEEAKRYTFLYGIGLEFQTGLPTAIGTNHALGQTGVSPRVSLDITRLNFRGRDHTISFKADVGSLQQRGLVSYIAPRLLGSPNWKVTFNAFYDNTLDVTTFTSQRLEGSVQADERINKTSTIDYGFVYRRVKASEIEISPAQIPLLSLPVRVGQPVLSYIRNTRDNDLETTKGMYIAGNAGVASSYFGSQADFSRVVIQDSTYHAFGRNRLRERKFVFARSTTLGVQNAYGKTAILPPSQCSGAVQSCENVIPLAERFLSGGGNSLRGFGLNQAGPRDPVTGFPLGGSALFINNTELRFPPPMLPYARDNMSFVLFEDAGNVFTTGNKMLNNLLHWRQPNSALCLQASTAAQCDFSYISHAVGLGVRYKTPIGPVRFDFGYNLNPPAFPSCQEKPSFSGQAQSSYCVANSQSNGQATLPYFVPQHASHFNVYFSIGQSF
jgi:outer membrane protein insertion porin family